MPPRIRFDVVVVDRSPLAQNLYQVLFSGQSRFRLTFAEEFQSLYKKTGRLRPDLLLVNSNALERGTALKFPCPTVLIVSKNRFDLKEATPESAQVEVIEKPFFPYDLLSLANRMVHDKREAPRRGRPPGRRKAKGG